ncbi:tRNA-dihydrouridine synthase family protein [bacterium]|nr:tRNA-dihydrouridine synthase family protein [bacterium]
METTSPHRDKLGVRSKGSFVIQAAIQTEHTKRDIGGIPFESPFTLAALSGYSDLAMRMVCRSLGACLTRHEVVLDQFILDHGTGPKSGEHLDPGDRPIACQLMGRDPVEMGQAARRMASFGYDIVDINFGCPVKKVLGRCRGGFLLSEPETAIQMVREVKAAVDVPVTIKMRRGLDESPLSRERFWHILSAAVDLGIAGVVVHGRTVDQRYEGFAKWEIIGEVKSRFPHLAVMGSGDLYTAEDCLRMLRETGCDGVTIARGAIENPWVFRDCLALWRGEEKPAPPTLAEQAKLFDDQYEIAINLYGLERATRQMRKFGIKRSKLHPEPEKVHRAFVTLSSSDDWARVRSEIYGVDSR